MNAYQPKETQTYGYDNTYRSFDPTGTLIFGYDVSANWFTRSNFEASRGTAVRLHQFTGKERDSESGLDYFGARYYGSALGRFTSPDWSERPEPVPYADLSNPQSLNQYVYVLNNPLGKADLDGHCGGVADCFFAGAKLAGSAASVGTAALEGAALGATAAIAGAVVYLGSPLTPGNIPSPEPGHYFAMAMEQGRDAQGKFLPTNPGDARPGSQQEQRGLDALGADKNTKPIPGSNRIPDGKTADGQYVEIKSGGSVANTEQVKGMADAAKDVSGKPLVVGTTNPNVKVSQTVANNPNIVVKPVKLPNQ